MFLSIVSPKFVVLFPRQATILLTKMTKDSLRETAFFLRTFLTDKLNLKTRIPWPIILFLIIY